MHLLIDVRTSSLSDRVHLSYGIAWAKLWMTHHPNDKLTFLAHTDDPVDADDVIFIERGWSLFQKKVAAHPYGPERIVSFSKLPTIDTSIPEIRHIFDMTDILYPASERGFFEHHRVNIIQKKIYNQARHLIIPTQDIMRELTELYTIDEHKISIIPYISATKNPLASTILPMGILGNYYIAECTPGDEWNPIELLRAYSHYIHDIGGSEKLILIGDLGNNLGVITTMIRTLDIIDSVKILGCLGEHERDLLYHHASGWIYIGQYYSRGGAIGLASGYQLPLYLSDISGLANYTAQYIHPNHIDTLAKILGKPHKDALIHPKPENALILEVYAKLIAS